MKIEPWEGVKLQNVAINVLAYADDVIIDGMLIEDSQAKLNINYAAIKLRLQDDEKKTEYVIIERWESLTCKPVSIKVDKF